MSEWRQVTLADICDRVDYGYTESASDDPKLPRFLRITDIVGSHIDWARVPGCRIDDDKFQRFRLCAGDIVVARTGATVGHAKRIRRHPMVVFASYLVRFRPSAAVVSSFVGAVVESTAYKEWVLQHAGGAAQPNASAKVLGAFPLLLPDRDTQLRIGYVLDSLDELIDNNRRRAEVMKEMAGRVYREWFVHLRYPGHHGAVVDSPIGPIPDDWEIKTLGEVSRNVDRLRKPLSNLQRRERAGSIPYYGAAKLIDWVDGWIFDGEYLLFAEDGSVQTSEGFPVLQLVEGKFWANNHTHILQGKGGRGPPVVATGRSW